MTWYRGVQYGSRPHGRRFRSSGCGTPRRAVEQDARVSVRRIPGTVGDISGTSQRVRSFSEREAVRFISHAERKQGRSRPVRNSQAGRPVHLTPAPQLPIHTRPINGA